MKNIILISPEGKPSARALFSHMKNCSIVEKVDGRQGRDLIRTHNKPENFSVYKSVPKDGYSINNAIVIRWANRVPLKMNNCIVYNKAEAVSKATNKKLARKLFAENKISTPLNVTPENFKEEYLPIIARPQYHSKCSNLRVLKTKEEFLNHYNKYEQKGWYYSQYIDKTNEYRIHCAHGKVLSISEKPKPKNHTEKNPVYGWGYSVVEEEWRVLKWSEYKYKFCKLALDAVKALGLDFGAVDIIVKDKTAYVIEINTGGSLTESPYLRQRYSMYFNWLFNSDKRKEHWDFSKFEAGKSCAWKNFQLND